MTADTANLPGSVEVQEGEDTRLFYDYLSFIQEMREKRIPIDARAKDSTLTEAERAQLLQDLEVLNVQVEAKQDRIQEEHGETLFAKMIRMVREPDVPEAPLDAANPQLWRYYRFRELYWARVDFQDGRLVRDPALHTLLEQASTPAVAAQAAPSASVARGIRGPGVGAIHRRVSTITAMAPKERLTRLGKSPCKVGLEIGHH